MQTTQLVQASADVVTITRLAPGDVYKRVEEGTSYTGTTLRFGIVQDVMNNGSEAAVTALEYETDYNTGVKVTLQVFTGSKPVAIYAATPEEVLAHMNAVELAADQARQRARVELEKRNAACDAVARMVLQVKETGLTAPEVVTGSVAGEVEA